MHSHFSLMWNRILSNKWVWVFIQWACIECLLGPKTTTIRHSVGWSHRNKNTSRLEQMWTKSVRSSCSGCRKTMEMHSSKTNTWTFSYCYGIVLKSSRSVLIIMWWALFFFFSHECFCTNTSDGDRLFVWWPENEFSVSQCVDADPTLVMSFSLVLM